jgi:GNAT superfamily N-acetyltransferase
MQDRLTRRTKLIYGCGDTGFSLTGTTIAAYFAIFLTDVVGISPGIAAIAIFVGRSWDYINDPLIGYLSDRTRTRWGRRRPFLLFGALPFALAFILMWYRPPIQNLVFLAIYYAFAYVLFDSAATFVYMPYFALTPELTSNYDERTSLTTIRMFFSILGSLIAYAVDLTKEIEASQLVRRLADRVRQRGRFVIRSADLAHWEDEIEKIYLLLNMALRHLPDYRSWLREVVFNSLAPFRKIVDPDLVLFAEDGDRTVGWLPGLPNLNEAFIHVNGLRNPWDYLKLWWYMRRQTECLTVKSVLVPQEYWGSGVAILLFDEMYQRALARGYKWIDGSLTSDDNPNTPALGARFGAKIYKRYRAYRMKI